jgi:hypothetical protein
LWADRTAGRWGLSQVDFHLAGGLGGIHMVDDALFAAQGADGGVLDHADLVVLHMVDTSTVSGRMAAASFSRSIRPLGSGRSR